MTEHHNQPAQPSDAQRAEQMATYGITCVPVDYFHFGEFRYTDLQNAVAQAKRKRSPT